MCRAALADDEDAELCRRAPDSGNFAALLRPDDDADAAPRKPPELTKSDRRLALGVDDAEPNPQPRPAPCEGSVRVRRRKPKRHAARPTE
jgi:hypothetical protein